MFPVLENYTLVAPGSLTEVLDDLSRHPGARPFAGGTDLMVMLESGHLPEGRYVSLQHCVELLGIQEIEGGRVSIGAMTTYTEIQRSPRLARDYPLLGMAARETGGVATQNRGTIGGNIANASPAADTPPVLLVYDAELELISSSGSRRVPYAKFHLGYKQMDLRAGEIIASVVLPPKGGSYEAGRGGPPKGGSYESEKVWLPPKGGRYESEKVWLPASAGRSAWRSYYRKVGTRRAQAISKVCLAGLIRVEANAVQDVRIAIGSVAPTVIRAMATEEALRGQPLDADTIAAAERALLTEIAPIDDIRSTARYRARVAANLLREFLTM